MNAGGKTQVVKLTDVDVGRMVLCKEKPATPATSACAKKLTETVTAAKKGLTPAQQKLWQQMVFVPAVLQAQRFCNQKSIKIEFGGPTNPNDPSESSRGEGLSTKQKYLRCSQQILNGVDLFKDLFGTEFKWSDYLLKGAEIIKKVRVTGDVKGENPWQDSHTNPKGPMLPDRD